MLQFLVFLLCTALVAYVTWRMTRRDDHASPDGLFLGGRSLGGLTIAMSLLLTNLSTEQMVGLNGAAFREGLCVMVWEVVAGVAIVLMALFFLPRFLRAGITTVPQLMGMRFDERTQVICNLIFLVAYAAILLPIILYTGATGLASILDLKAITGIASDTAVLWLCVWLVGIGGTIYAIYGGLRAIAVSDTLYGAGLLVGGMLITWFGLQALGGGDVLAGMHALAADSPERLSSLGGPTSSVPFSTVFTGILLLNVFYWCTNQQIIQRTLGASSLRAGQKGVLLCGVLKLLGPLYLVVPGMIAFQLFRDGGVAPDQAYGALVARVLPTALTGFFAAVMFGAILSSFNAALNSATTLFTVGVWRGMVDPGASDARLMQISRRFGWAMAVAAMVIAPLLAGQASIFAYLQTMNGMYFIPILAVVVVVGLTTTRVPPFAAQAGLIGGILLIAAGYFVPALHAWVARMHEFHFLGLVFAILVAGMLLLGRLRPLAAPRRLPDVGAVDLTPWRWAPWASAAIVVVVVGLYVALAR
jgi:SSS family solute:Na+ symporter